MFSDDLELVRSAFREMYPDAAEREIADEVDGWFAQEDSGEFHIGCFDYRTRQAAVFAIGALRQMATTGADPDEAIRRLLLALAAMEEID